MAKSVSQKKSPSKKSTSSKKIVVKDKNKAKKLNETFFYDRKKLILLAVFNVFLVFLIWNITSCLLAKGLITTSFEIALHILVMTLALLALAGSLFVAIHPLRLALVTDNEITIDHNVALKWKDIEVAKEFKASYIYTQQAIALHVRKGVTHKLTFMQKICKNNVFTPFSIPLYAMTPKDAQKIRKIIKQKCKYENTIK